MADNSAQNATDTIRDKDRAGVKTQVFGLDLGIGTGTESLMAGSMPATEADGANVTIGAKADSSALTGTVTLMSLVKGLISLFPQSLGQKAMAGSVGVTLASDQAPIADKSLGATVMNASGSTCAFSMEGYTGAIIHVVNSGLTGAFRFKGSGDGGATWGDYVLAGRTTSPGQTQTTSFSWTADSTTSDYYVQPMPGISHVQVVFDSYTSGSATVTPRSTMMQWAYGPPTWTQDGGYDGFAGSFQRVGGLDSVLNNRQLRLNNATAPGSSDWGMIVRDQGNMGQFVLANAVTSPASATTVVQSTGIITGLDKFRSLMITARLLGATGGVLDVYLQASPDSGTTWFDVVHFPQIAAAAAVRGYIAQLSRGNTPASATIAVNGVDGTPALAAAAIVPGDFGDRIRYVFVGGASTTAGAVQTIKISGTT